MNTVFRIQKGFSFIDVLVGIALMVIVFSGIFAAFRLGLKVVGQSQRRVVATAVAQAKIEEIRNLPYDSIGVIGGFPDGVLPSATSTVFNNTEYSVDTRVDFVVDSADGTASPLDDCPTDYKKAEVRVSWSGLFSGEVSLYTDITPKNLAQECGAGGGILAVSVFDAYGVMVASPLIEIKDPATDQLLKTAAPPTGEHYFSLATSTYKVVVSKDSYSQERTYGAEEVATPEKPHLMVLEGMFTESSFSIDRMSSLSVRTFSPWGQDSFVDSFLDESKISELSDLRVNQEEVNLATTSDGYVDSGYLFSTGVTPASLINWDELAFEDSEPAETDLKYQVYYATNTDWFIVPEEDLTGNSEGFDLSPVDLSGLDVSEYFTLKLKANFSTNATSVSPTLRDWQVSWITSTATPIPNVDFALQGAKIIGTDAGESPVYKYYQSHTSGSAGSIALADLEWDVYTFSVASETDLDLIDTEPSPQPISLPPDTALTVDLYLEAENSLLLTLQNTETLEPIFAATARLQSTGLGYDVSQFTNSQGQTYFIPLAEDTYTLGIEAPAYAPATTTVSVFGDVTTTVKLEQIE